MVLRCGEVGVLYILRFAGARGLDVSAFYRHIAPLDRKHTCRRAPINQDSKLGKSVVPMVLGFRVPVQPSLQPSGRGDPAPTGKSTDFWEGTAGVKWVIFTVVNFCLTI